MADYKRLVSYMYQYENGVKKKNVGFVRVEAKSGQCKITLHMQLLFQNDSIFPTYLIQRGDNNMDLIYLGDTILKNQVMDSKLDADESNVMNSGYGLSDMGGLLLFLNDKVYFATEWDDKPIVANEVLEALRPKTIRQTAPEMAENTEGMFRTGQPDEYEKKPEQTSNKSEQTPESSAQKPEGTPQSWEKSPQSWENELAMPRYKLPGGWKMIERLQSSYYTSSENQIDNEEELAKNQINEDQIDENQVNEDYINEDQINENLVFEDQNIENMIREDSAFAAEVKSDDTYIQSPNYKGLEDIPQEDHPTAKRFFENYPRIYPFEDNEIILCVKIEPKDFGILPKEIWPFSNNSFLMHGFYCYHHLIFAKIKNKFGCRYIIGVPGIYHDREQFMARMFGFENFKSIRKRELKQGDFGYWYLPVYF